MQAKKIIKENSKYFICVSWLLIKKKGSSQKLSKIGHHS